MQQSLCLGDILHKVHRPKDLVAINNNISHRLGLPLPQPAQSVSSSIQLRISLFVNNITIIFWVYDAQ